MKATVDPRLALRYVVVEYDNYGVVKSKHRFSTKEEAKDFTKKNGNKFRYKGVVE